MSAFVFICAQNFSSVYEWLSLSLYVDKESEVESRGEVCLSAWVYMWSPRLLCCLSLKVTGHLRLHTPYCSLVLFSDPSWLCSMLQLPGELEAL